jgi:hypothetical protein
MQVESKIDLAYVIEAINKGTLKEEEVLTAKQIVDNEIMQCENVLQDDETEALSRREFQAKLSIYRKLKNRL